MKKKPRRAKSKPPDLSAQQFNQHVQLVMLGANLFYAGMKQAAPQTTVAPQEFSVDAPQHQPESKERLPDV